jgi:hypothetical protein
MSSIICWRSEAVTLEYLLFDRADYFHIIIFDDGWADFTVQPISTTNQMVYHLIHCVKILLRFVIWMKVRHHYIVIQSIDTLLRSFIGVTHHKVCVWFHVFELLFSKAACIITKSAVFGAAWQVMPDISVEIARSKLDVK